MLWCTVGLAAPLTYELYKQSKVSTDPQAAQIMDLYVEGLLQGIKWTNAQTRVDSVKKHKRPFCPPPKMVLELANAKTIIHRTAEHLSKGVSESELNDMAIVHLLLLGLHKTFPCD